MPQSFTPEQAATALTEIETARTAMRRAIRDHRGHYQLWIWGAAWIAMPLTAHFRGDYGARFFPWICLVAGIVSGITGFRQKAQIRRPTNGRFIAILGTIWLFAALFPFVLRASLDPRLLYAYACLVAMQTYVITGLWTDSYLLWVGLAVTALILVGIFLFPAIFWLWMAVFGGGTLVLTGFYVRHFWR